MRYFFFSADHPLTYLSCGNLISKEEFLHHRRNFDVNVLILVQEGHLFLSQNNVNYDVSPGQYLFLRAGEEHYGYQASSGKLSYLWVHFQIPDEVAVISKGPSPHLTEAFPKNPDGSAYILPEYGEILATQRASLLFHQLLDVSRQDTCYFQRITDYALSLLILELSQEFIAQQYRDKTLSPNVVRIMEWIKGNYFKPITISEIAAEFGYNPDYLSALFAKTTGTTLSSYIHKVRIDNSKSLLVNYDVPLKEVAYSCGFSDEKYYMKVFKKLEGMTPSQYKKAFSRKLYNHQDRKQ